MRIIKGVDSRSFPNEMIIKTIPAITAKGTKIKKLYGLKYLIYQHVTCTTQKTGGCSDTFEIIKMGRVPDKF